MTTDKRVQPPKLESLSHGTSTCKPSRRKGGMEVAKLCQSLQAHKKHGNYAECMASGKDKEIVNLGEQMSRQSKKFRDDDGIASRQSVHAKRSRDLSTHGCSNDEASKPRRKTRKDCHAGANPPNKWKREKKNPTHPLHSFSPLFEGRNLSDDSKIRTIVI